MIKLLVFTFNQVHAQIHECELLLRLTNHLLNSLQTRKVTELIFAAVLQADGAVTELLISENIPICHCDKRCPTNSALVAALTFTCNSLHSDFKLATMKLNKVFYRCFLCANSSYQSCFSSISSFTEISSLNAILQFVATEFLSTVTSCHGTDDDLWHNY